MPDHFGDQLSPIAALMSAADATTKLRVCSLVFDNDYRHPALLAKEAATLDLLSDGRLDFGLGAGWMTSDYEQAGIPLDPPGVRIDRMAEALTIINADWESPVDPDAKVARMKDGTTHLAYKAEHVVDLDSEFVLAARVTPANAGDAETMIDSVMQAQMNLDEATETSEGSPNRIVIKEAAGDRISEIELAVSIFIATVTDDRDAVAEAMAPGIGCEPRDVLEVPHFLIGTVEQIIEDLKARRERFGISYPAIPGEAAEALAPVVERLTGT